MTKYAVISNDPDAFFLGRYSTLELAQKAIGNKPDIWCLYKMIDIDKDDFEIENLDPDKRSWYYDDDGTKRRKPKDEN